MAWADDGCWRDTRMKMMAILTVVAGGGGCDTWSDRDGRSDGPADCDWVMMAFLRVMLLITAVTQVFARVKG